MTQRRSKPSDNDLPTRRQIHKTNRPHGGVAPSVGHYGMTLEEIAQAMGVTRERVRQIEAEAMFKIRKYLRSKGLDKRDIYDK